MWEVGGDAAIEVRRFCMFVGFPWDANQSMPMASVSARTKKNRRERRACSLVSLVLTKLHKHEDIYTAVSTERLGTEPKLSGGL